MYLLNFFSNKFIYKIFEKKFAIMYKIKAPVEIDKTETRVPIHLPNKIPETSNSGEPKPINETQITENKKKIIIFIERFEVINFSKSNCNCL